MIKAVLIVGLSLVLTIALGQVPDDDIRRLLGSSKADSGQISGTEKKWILPAISGGLSVGHWLYCRIKKCKRDFNEEINVEDLKRALNVKEGDDEGSGSELSSEQKRILWALPWIIRKIKNGKRELEETIKEDDLKRALNVNEVDDDGSNIADAQKRGLLKKTFKFLIGKRENDEGSSSELSSEQKRILWALPWIIRKIKNGKRELEETVNEDDVKRALNVNEVDDDGSNNADAQKRGLLKKLFKFLIGKRENDQDLDDISSALNSKETDAQKSTGNLPPADFSSGVVPNVNIGQAPKRSLK